MANHPDKARFDRALAGFSGEARTRRLFELMARWPDDARKGPYDHPGWHYWLRLVPSQADPAKVPPAMLAMSTGEAAEAYRLNLATVRDAYAPAADRAVSLCWLFHLAGDIQQPLHGGHLISGRFPLSDRAGESAFVRPADGTHDRAGKFGGRFRADEVAVRRELESLGADARTHHRRLGGQCFEDFQARTAADA